MKEPWEKQPGETQKQYLAFKTYLHLPWCDRNVTAAFAQRRAQGKLPLKNTHYTRSGQWQSWSVAWRWKERADAWDAYLDRQADERLERRYVEYRRAQIELQIEDLQIWKEESAITRAEIQKLCKMPAVSIEEKQFNDDGTIGSIRKISAVDRRQIAALKKELREERKAAAFGLNPPKPGEAKMQEGEVHEDSQPRALRLIVNDYVAPPD